MDEGFTRREKLAGFFLLVMVLVTKVTLLVIAQGKGWFLSQQTYLIRFKQGYNLRQGSLVKMFNTEAGKVTNMRISRVMDENQVEVTIKVLTEYTDLIRQDSVAEVVSPTIIGSEYIDVSPGSSGYPKIEEYGTIPSRVRKTMTENLAELVNAESIREIKTILSNLAQLSEQLKTDNKALLAAINSFNQVWVNLLESRGSLGQLVMQRDFYTRLMQSTDQLNKTLQEAHKVVGELKPATQDLQGFMKTLHQETATIKSILADIKGGTQEFPGLMDTATETARTGKDVVDAVKANPVIRMTLPQEPKNRAIHVEPRQVP